MSPNDPSRSNDPVWRERLTAYLDGELSPAEAREVLAWLESHPAALRELEADRRVWALLSAYRDEAVPAGFSERVLEKTGKTGASGSTPSESEPAPRMVVLPGGRARRYAALAATVVLAVGVGVFASNRFSRPPESTAPSSLSALDAVPAALLESDEVVTKLASLSDDDFEALLQNDPDKLAQAVK